MIFTLEVLQARKGDALLLHYGDKAAPQLAVIDGGPGGVYDETLRPRLEELRAARGGEQLRIRLMLVSHIDDDHINGLIRLASHVATQRAEQQQQDYVIDVLWHNAFDDVFGTVAEELIDPAADGTAAASAVDALVGEFDISEGSALMLASTAQGQALRNHAQELGLSVNSGFDGLVMAAAGQGHKKVGGMAYRVLGPSRTRLIEFQDKWNKDLKKKADKAKAASYLDESAFNLASIVVLAEFEGRTMLLTGDGRGDDIIVGAKEAGLLDDGGRYPVDILKVPHHGSNRNVEVDFFQSFPAKHYVMSGDGSHGNPEPETFEMLFEARAIDDEKFTIHLTYEPEAYKAHRDHEYDVARLRAALEPHEESGRVTVMTPQNNRRSMKIDLLDPSVD